MANSIFKQHYAGDYYLMALQKMTFCVSPINKRLLEKNFKQNMEVNRVGQLAADWLWAILHPIKLLESIEQYHMVDRRWFLLFLGQIVFFAHIIIKCLVHIIFDDQQSAQYFDSIYYPNISARLPNSKLMNGFWFSFSAASFFCRLICLHTVIRGSIINRDFYKEISVSQVNISSVVLASNYSFKDIHDFIINSIKHDNEVEKNFHSRIAHFSIFSDNDMKCLNTKYFNRTVKLIYMNMIDFGECYTMHPIREKLVKIKDEYKLWFLAEPIHRMSPSVVRFLAYISPFLSVSIIVGTLGFYAIYIYSEVIADLDLANNMFSQDIILVWLTPLRIIKTIEVIAFILVQLPFHIQTTYVNVDTAILLSRVQRVTDLMIFELDFTKCLVRKEMFTKVKSADDLTLYKIRTHKQSILFNEKYSHYIQLADITYMEFIDIRDTHCLFLNSILVGSGFATSFALTLFYLVDTPVEIGLVILVLYSCVAPCFSLIIYCTEIERKVSLIDSFGKAYLLVNTSKVMIVVFVNKFLFQFTVQKTAYNTSASSE